MKDLSDLISNLQKDKRLYTYGEASTKQAVILPILNILGWDTHNIDEITPEYSLRGKKVDYCLRHNGSNKIFLEVKKVSEELGNHEEQILMYCFEEGVKLAILTNGITWWFYLPLKEGSWREKRKFYTIDIYEQLPEEIAEMFNYFLSKDKVISGEAFNNAEKIYENRQKKNKIKKAIPNAWYKLINESNEDLIRLISETTESISGYRPQIEEVEDFLGECIKKIPEEISTKSGDRLHKKTRKTANNGKEKKDRVPIRKGYTGKKIVSFKFMDKNINVKSWRDLLLNLCEILVSTKGQLNFEKVLKLEGRKRPYFSKNPNLLRVPERIKDTDIYVETNLSSNSIVQLSKIVISLFEYEDKDLEIISE